MLDSCSAELMPLEDGVEEGAGIQEQEEEEAVRLKPARDPKCPTNQERAAHEATHMPFRIWCEECVKGRLTNRAHSHQKEECHEVPSVHLDYAFVSKSEDEKSLVILITKDRDSRVVMADVVSRKGACRRGAGSSGGGQCPSAWAQRKGYRPSRQRASLACPA